VLINVLDRAFEQPLLPEEHAAMPLAGGIGLCGGACEALGAAIWIIGMNCREEQGVDNRWKDDGFQTRIGDLIERFLKSTDYNFECSEIVGRKFENIADHAAHLRDEGCSEILEVLANQEAPEIP